MGWTSETVKGVETIVGPIGDPLAIQIVADFYGDIDFDDHVWLCQIRRTVLDTTAITLNWREDATETAVTTVAVTTDNPTGKITTLTILFDLEDTTVLDGGVTYVYGVKATESPYGPWTIIAKDPIRGYNVVPREGP